MHDLQGTHAPPKVFMLKVILNPPVSDVEVGSLKGGSRSGPEAVPPEGWHEWPYENSGESQAYHMLGLIAMGCPLPCWDAMRRHTLGQALGLSSHLYKSKRNPLYKPPSLR